MKKRRLPLLLLVPVILLLLSWVLGKNNKVTNTDWAEYLGGPDRNHYSTLDQVNLSNVNQLKQVWEYHTLDSGQMQCNPIIVNGVLYGMTASTQPFAIDAATGQEIWRKQKENDDRLSTSRGLVYWEEGNDKRILYSRGPWLTALNAATGEKILSFGDS